MRPDALGNEGQMGLCLERLVGVTKSPVQGIEVTAEPYVFYRGFVDCGADQVLSQQARVEIEHALAIAATRRGTPVVNDMRWKHADRRAARTAMVPVEVVSDLTVIDDEDRPRVMRVGRVGVVLKLGVQHLADAGYRRPPRPNSLGGDGAGHAKNVQDTPTAASLYFGWT